MDIEKSLDSIKDWQGESSLLPNVPKENYQPIKRCKYCQSIHLDDIKCESCGRMINYHPVGEPFGPKSFYAIKENYLESLNFLVKGFSSLENKKSPDAIQYAKKLLKRLDLLLLSLAERDEQVVANQKKFKVEIYDLVDELLRYGESKKSLQMKFEIILMESKLLLAQELIHYLGVVNIEIENFWSKRVLNLRIKFYVLTLAVVLAISFFATWPMRYWIN